MTRDSLYDLYKDDWQYVDAIEEVTWTPRGQGQISGIKAIRGDITKGQFRFMGQEFLDLGCDTVMAIWDATILGDVRPQGDKSTVVDAHGKEYTLEFCKQVVFDTQWLLGLKLKA